MTQDEIVGQADIADPAVRRLIEPGVLGLLDSLPLSDRYVSALWVGDIICAAVAARIDNVRHQAEIISLATLAKLRESEALALALRGLCGAQSAAGNRTFFDPMGYIAPATQRSLHAAGLSPDGPQWTWYEFDGSGLARVRASMQRPPKLQSRRLVDATAAQITEMRSVGDYGAHPDDLPSLSPVLLDEAGQVISFIIVRRGREGVEIPWAWSHPEHRRSGLVMIAGDIMFDLLVGAQEHVRFRVSSNNGAMRHLIDGAMQGSIKRQRTTRTWTHRGEFDLRDSGSRRLPQNGHYSVILGGDYTRT